MGQTIKFDGLAVRNIWLQPRFDSLSNCEQAEGGSSSQRSTKRGNTTTG